MGGRAPTWRMVPGSSSESLALDVALQCQVPPDIVYRAAQLFKVQNLSHPPPPDLLAVSLGNCCPYTVMHFGSSNVALLCY